MAGDTRVHLDNPSTAGDSFGVSSNRTVLVTITFRYNVTPLAKLTKLNTEYRLLVIQVVEPGSVREEGELGTGIGKREGYGFWRHDDAENLWPVGDLRPEI